MPHVDEVDTQHAGYEELGDVGTQKQGRNSVGAAAVVLTAFVGVVFAGTMFWFQMTTLGSPSADDRFHFETVATTHMNDSEGYEWNPEIMMGLFKTVNLGELPALNLSINLLASGGCHVNLDNPGIRAYCDANTVNKVLVFSGDCRRFTWVHGVLDIDRAAMESCRRAGLTGCQVIDRQGDACFACKHVPSSASKNFARYCAARTPKSWYMTSSCGFSAWSSSSNPPPGCQGKGCHLFDYNGLRCPCNGVKGDFRCKLQPCLQYNPDWCWATSVSVIAGYYRPGEYPNHDDHGPNCRGVECRIVGEQHHPKDPSACCRNKKLCATESGSYLDIVQALGRYTGIGWGVKQGIISQNLLTKILLDRHPMMVGVVWQNGGGHVMVLGGTNGHGIFYLHDPFHPDGRGSFQSLTYDQVVHYTIRYSGRTVFGTMNAYFAPAALLR
jgi:hypothetical protein